MVVEKKVVCNSKVTLVKNLYNWQVIVDGEIYYTGCNKLFAVQKYNEI